MKQVDVSLLNFGLAAAMLVIAFVMLISDSNNIVALALIPIAMANITIGLAVRDKRSETPTDTAGRDD